ncbi:MAG: hypothetical protein RLZZ595_1630 [Bacteroidota bacterium]|jgi:phosphopantetheine--protein transferase-like protein
MPMLMQKATATFSLGVWKIEEEADFFSATSDYHSDATHPARKLQQMATRFLLLQLEPSLPVRQIVLGEAGKPMLENNKLEFNLSHTAQMAAAIVGKMTPVGIDLEKISERVLRIQNKFLHPNELLLLEGLGKESQISILTRYWTIKEAVYKWWGKGGVDFANDIVVENENGDVTLVRFHKNDGILLRVHCLQVEDHWLAYVVQ